MTLMHPSSIWLYLAQFFTREVLVSLMTAERTTRALLGERVAASLEEQYRDLDFRFLHLTDGTAERLWKRTVADHVRVLRIGPYFVCDALDGSRCFPFEATMQPVGRLLARFRHVEEYHILWHERPIMSTVRPLGPNHDHLSNTFRLASAILAVPFSAAPNIRTLTVDVSLDKAQHLFLPNVILPSLEDLTLRIRDDHHAGTLDAAGYIMVHHLARFLNNMHLTLRSLSFETSLKADFSPFFSALGTFAHLSKLVLAVPTVDPYLGDPSALKGFLQAQRDVLKEFTLRGFCTGKVQGGMVNHWLTDCLSGVTFSSLHTLNVGTSFIPVDVVTLCIRQCPDTLTSLDIAGEYLSFAAVQDVLCAIADRPLRSLGFGVTCLCPELVDLLAEHLPRLTKLSLRIQAVSPHREEPSMFIGGSRKQNQSQVERFRAEMGTREYEGWGLREVAVWKYTSKLQYQGWCVDILRDSLGQH